MCKKKLIFYMISVYPDTETDRIPIPRFLCFLSVCVHCTAAQFYAHKQVLYRGYSGDGDWNENRS